MVIRALAAVVMVWAGWGGGASTAEHPPPASLTRHISHPHSPAPAPASTVSVTTPSAARKSATGAQLERQ